MRRKLTIPFIIGILGLAIMGTAILADRIGLDPSKGWGRIRIALLIFGICITLCSVLFWRYMDETLNGLRRIQSFAGNHPLVAGIRGNTGIAYTSGLFRKYWFAIPILILVACIYIWFISTGTWTTWVSPTHLYADLTRGFLKGKLYLPIKVSANLLKSPDPYNPSIGLGLQGPLDVSYFKGKYYLYWGPVPALVLLIIHPVIYWRVGDLQLLFSFLTGLYILQTLLAVIIWDRFFSNLPKYILWLSILLLGLASPATFMLDSSRGARIYEAAITGGQFFLVGGFIAAMTALDQSNSRWRLAVAGISWALAIGTRLILVLPVGFLVLMVAGWSLWVDHWSFNKIKELIPLIVPLVLGFVILGWYNWARFESVFESGYFYQMTAVSNFQQHYSELISPIFILQNLYNYFLYPFGIQPQFPYFIAEYGKIDPLFSAYPLPSIYFSQKITGLVYTVPFLIFALIPPVTFFIKLFKNKAALSSPRGDEQHLLNWITLALSGACLAVFGFLFSFFWASTRYSEDMMPGLIMLGIIGFWQGYKFLSNRTVWKRLYASLGILLIVVSILSSTLVALSVNGARLEIVRYLSFAR